MSIFQILQKLSLVPSYLWDAMWAPVWKRCMKHCGKGGIYPSDVLGLQGLVELVGGGGHVHPEG